MEIESNIIDDQGIDQSEVRKMLREFRDNGFDGDDERAGLALGRSANEIRELISGDQNVDDDLAMKIRRIADERGIKFR